ncbi:factor H binding protein domain-containing protein [Rodentibacter ratti]|uniref:Factor H binding protein-like C-terminal domain-containing protein n=1 Tax=Rodentibacter ratti TaxID=1906745 RepID=A0A1V3LBQ4_9PAST|nr:factor H binding protein domain-containing protein [Rodentibacter ratti]OOF87068.1 hypothetical protein BKG88_03355 [Rodentibacter ratti]
MKLKNLSVATTLLLALTGCGSSGGGNSNSSPSTPNNEIQNAQTTQNQTNQQIELNKIKSQLAQSQSEKQSTEEKLKQVNAELAKNQQALTQSTQSLQESQKQVQALQEEKTRLDQAIAQAQSSNTQKAQEIETLTAEKARVESELNSAKSNLEKALKDKANLSENLENKNVELAQKQQALAQSTQSLQENQKQVQALQEEKTRLDQAIAQTLSSNTQKAQEIETLTAEKAQVESELNNVLENTAQQKQILNEFNELIKTVVENEQAQGRYSNVIGGRYTTDIDSLNNGLHTIPFVMMYSEDGEGAVAGGYSTIYKQNYSIVYGREMKFYSSNLAPFGNYRIERFVDGEKTTTLPSEGNATYRGKAFTSTTHEGDLTYNVNFATRTGSGKLSNFNEIDDINLDEGRIGRANQGNGQGFGIESSASMADGTKGEYELAFYGPNAEEIAGKAYMYKQLDNTMRVNGGTAREYNQKDEQGNVIRGTQFGFGGTRGEIQK